MVFYYIRLGSMTHIHHAGLFTYARYHNNEFEDERRQHLIELAIIEKGSVYRVEHGDPVLVKPNDFLCVMPDFRGYMHSVVSGETHSHLSICMHGDFTYEIFHSGQGAEPYHILSERYYQADTPIAIIPQVCSLSEFYPEVYRLLYGISRANLTKNAGDQLICFSHWYAVLSLLTRYSLKLLAEESKISAAPSHHIYVQKAVEYVVAHLHETVYVGDIAGYLGISPNYLNAVFKMVTGYSMVHYIKKVKIDKLKELIANGQTLKQAGAQVGCCDTSYLCKLFKRYTGMSIQNYKQLLGGTMNTNMR